MSLNDLVFLHLKNTRNIAEETCLVPAAAAEGEGEREPNAASFNFITDIFFLAHKCLDLGFRVVQEKFIKLNQELNRTQELYRDVQKVVPRLRDPSSFQPMPEAAGDFTQPRGHFLDPFLVQGGPGERRRPGGGGADPAEDGRGHDQIPDDQGGAARARDVAPYDGDDLGDVRPPRAGRKERSDTLVIMYSAVQLNVGISCVERGLS